MDATIYLSIGALTSCAVYLAYERAKHGSDFDGKFHKVMGAVQSTDELAQKNNRQRSEIIDLRASLISIRNQGIKSASGTAQSMARKAAEALK